MEGRNKTLPPKPNQFGDGSGQARETAKNTREKRKKEGEINWYDLELIPNDYRINISLRKPVSVNIIKCSLKIPNKSPEIT